MRANPFQALPDFVEIGGNPVRINSDFRMGIAIELEILAADPDIAGLLGTFYMGQVPDPAEEAAERMIEFYAHSDHEGEKRGDGSGKPRRVYDFDQDAGALLSSFLDAYGIDLSTAKLHWWIFKHLLCNLPPETPFMQRIYYRTAETRKMDKAEREHVLKMRRLYALRNPESVGKSAKDLDQAFLEKARRRYEEARQAVKER